MHIKSDFILRKVASSWMAVPIGKRTGEVAGLVALNESAAFLWNFFCEEHTEGEAVEALLVEYDIDRDTAVTAVGRFLSEMEREGLLES